MNFFLPPVDFCLLIPVLCAASISLRRSASEYAGSQRDGGGRESF